jgi:MFS family permease
MAIFTFQGSRDIVNVLLPAIQSDFGLSYTVLGLVAASYDWGHAALLLLGGYLSDRYGKARTILAGLAWFVIASAATGLAPTYWSLIGLRLATGFAFGAYFVAGNSLLAEAFAPSERGRAIGLHYAGGSAGRFAIPLLAGAITISAGWRFAFLPLSLAAVVAAILFFFLKRPSSSPAPAAVSVLDVIWRRLLRDRQMLRVTLIYALVIFTNFEIIFVPVYLVRNWGLPVFEAAAYLSIAALVAIPSAPLMGELSDRLGWRTVVTAALAGDVLLLGLFPFVPPGPLLVLALVCLGVANRSLSVSVALVTRASEPSTRGIARGVVNTVGIISLTVLSVVGGYVADVAGLASTFFMIAVVALAGCIALLTTRLGQLDLRW